MKGLSMLAQSLIQPPHRAGVHVNQTRRTFQGTAFGQKCPDGDGFGFTNLGVPQGGLLALTELTAADATAQVSNPISTVTLWDRQVMLTGLPLQFTAFVDAR